MRSKRPAYRIGSEVTGCRLPGIGTAKENSMAGSPLWTWIVTSSDSRGHVLKYSARDKIHASRDFFFSLTLGAGLPWKLPHAAMMASQPLNRARSGDPPAKNS